MSNASSKPRTFLRPLSCVLSLSPSTVLDPIDFSDPSSEGASDGGDLSGGGPESMWKDYELLNPSGAKGEIARSSDFDCIEGSVD